MHGLDSSEERNDALLPPDVSRVGGLEDITNNLLPFSSTCYCVVSHLFVLEAF